MIKYFTNKETKTSVAVNPSKVIYVADTGYGPKIIFDGGIYIIVAETYVETVARLNERD